MERMRMPVPVGRRRPIILIMVGIVALGGVMLSFREPPAIEHAIRGAVPTASSIPPRVSPTARSGMSPTPSVVPDDLPHTTVIGFDHPGDYVSMVINDGLVYFQVSLDDLPTGSYSIGLENPTGGGTLFGAGNAHFYRGQLDGETVIRPQAGRIVLWSIHPLRMMTSRDVKIILHSLDDTLPFTRTSAPLEPPLPSLEDIIPPDLMYATDVVSALNGLGLTIQSVKSSIYNSFFVTTDRAVFIQTNQGVVEVIFFPVPLDESLVIEMPQDAGGYLYVLSGPLVGPVPKRIDSTRPVFFIPRDTLLFVTSTLELAELLEGNF